MRSAAAKTAGLAGERLAELNCCERIGCNQVAQSGAALLNGQAAKILAVEMQEVEGVEDEPVRLGGKRRLQQPEVG